MIKDTEILHETFHGPRWFKLCRKKGCSHTQYDDSGFCYPHSRWYRPLLVPINRFVSWLKDLWEKNND